MKVKALIQFKDLKEQEMREIGDVFEVDQDRYDFIVKNAGPIIEIVEDNSQENDNLTVSEIKALLDEKEIEYPKSAKKEDLLKLLNGEEA